MGAGSIVVVFVHGGVHTGQCWDDTIAVIDRIAPAIVCLAVNMPGRGGVPGDLASLTIEQCIRSLAGQITDGLHDRRDTHVVLVGHSLAGVVVPGVVDRLHGRIDHVIFVASCVPPQGRSVADTLTFPLNHIVRGIVRRSPVISRPPPGLVRFFFANGATPAQRRSIQAGICPESSAVLMEVPKAAMSPSIRTSWVLTTRDRALRPATQRGFIRSLGNVDTVIEIDAGHEVMITDPDLLALQLVDLVNASRAHVN